MYIPKHFEEKDLMEIAALMAEFSFATLVTAAAGMPMATHIPLVLEIDGTGQWILHGHMARANQQWKSLTPDADVLAIFMGPHSYVSPSWYDQPNVPTWNYRAVHAHGRATIIEGEALIALLRGMMHRYESAHAAKPMSFDEVPADILETDLRGLVGFDIRIERIEAASKLSQNRNEASYDSVIGHLKKLDAYDSQRIAIEMQKKKSST